MYNDIWKYSEKVQKAIFFAIAAHEAVEQRRKYTDEPYWHHPVRVTEIVHKYGGNDDQLMAAALHDTVEDTGVTLATIEKLFGKKVSSLVSDLTDISVPEDGNRAVRKELDRQHTAAADPRAKTVKLADLIDNTSSIMEHDTNFARIYLKEKEALLEVLTEGDIKLYEVAFAVLQKSKAELHG